MLSSLLAKLFRRKPTTALCPYCTSVSRLDDLWSRCRRPTCKKPVKGVPPEAVRRLGGRTVFRTRPFRHSVDCPECGTDTVLKVCPRCWTPLPISMSAAATLTIVGSRGSGKSSYLLGLVKALEHELARNDAFEMHVAFQDDASLDYVTQQIQILRSRGGLQPTGQVAAPTDSNPNQTPTVQFTLKFPSWQNARKDERRLATAPMILHDPAGEWFKNDDNLEMINFLRFTRSLILLVDPDTFPATDAVHSLNRVSRKLRGQFHLTEESQRIPIDLAVVFPKHQVPNNCFGASRLFETLDLQSAPYNPAITDEVSRCCGQILNDRCPALVNAATHNFEHVRFFVCDSYGDAFDGQGRFHEELWKPYRVEDALLWLLHRRKLV